MTTEEKMVSYKAYLLQMLFMDMDEVIDSSPPLSFEEFCEKLEGESAMENKMDPHDVISELDKIIAQTDTAPNGHIIKQALDAAKAAVEKQIPQKVIQENCVSFPFSSTGYCPKCHEEMICDRLRKKPYISYCFMCGQCIDWNEVRGNKWS